MHSCIVICYSVVRLCITVVLNTAVVLNTTVWLCITVFNAIVRLCIADLQSALIRVLKKPQAQSKTDSEKRASIVTKGKVWTKLKPDVKQYLTDLSKVDYIII